MLLGSGPSKKFNMQSFFKTLRNGLKGRKVQSVKVKNRSRNGCHSSIGVISEISETRRTSLAASKHTAVGYKHAAVQYAAARGNASQYRQQQRQKEQHGERAQQCKERAL